VAKISAIAFSCHDLMLTSLKPIQLLRQSATEKNTFPATIVILYLAYYASDSFPVPDKV
jgi:hypothetical protein